ncbi:MAG: YciI family protein [Pseudomonadota bacterium]
MLYVLICEDKPDSEPLRKATRDAHLAYLQDYDVRLAGPMLSDDGEHMIGSVLMVEVADRAGAEAFAASDPYNLAGLFANVTIRAFRQVIPA